MGDSAPITGGILSPWTPPPRGWTLPQPKMRLGDGFFRMVYLGLIGISWDLNQVYKPF